MTIHRAVLRQTAFIIGIVIVCLSDGMPFWAAAAQAQSLLPYDDMKSNYATAAIINVTDNQLMNGTGSRRFEPNKPVSRAELTAMLDRMLGILPTAAPLSTYTDVPSGAWYYEWVHSAVQLGIAQGVSASRFEPKRALTREEAAVLMARALKLTNMPEADIPSTIYKDQKTIADWSLPSVYQLHRLKLMLGDASGFRPHDSITRQEAAIILDRVWSHPGWAKQITGRAPARIQLGWQYGQTTAQFEQQVILSGINIMSPRWYFLSTAGTFEDYTDDSLTSWAHQRGKQVWAMVGNRSDERSTHRMLTDSARRAAFIEQLTDRVSRHGIDGLNIDFENMMPQDRDGFTAFVSELHRALQKLNAVLSVNVSPDLGTDWTAVFDYAALGKHADYIVLMGYDEHWSTSPIAGSVSSLPWLRHGLETLLAQVPPEQIIAAFPLYTRDWTVNDEGYTFAADISLLQQNELVLAKHALLQWDEQLGQYYTDYDDEYGARHQIWLEDGRSIARKVIAAESVHVAGYAYWYMGGESADMWTSVRNAIQYTSVIY